MILFALLSPFGIPKCNMQMNRDTNRGDDSDLKDMPFAADEHSTRRFFAPLRGPANGTAELAHRSEVQGGDNERST